MKFIEDIDIHIHLHVDMDIHIRLHLIQHQQHQNHPIHSKPIGMFVPSIYNTFILTKKKKKNKKKKIRKYKGHLDLDHNYYV